MEIKHTMSWSREAASLLYDQNWTEFKKTYPEKNILFLVPISRSRTELDFLWREDGYNI